MVLNAIHAVVFIRNSFRLSCLVLSFRIPFTKTVIPLIGQPSHPCVFIKAKNPSWHYSVSYKFLGDLFIWTIYYPRYPCHSELEKGSWELLLYMYDIVEGERLLLREVVGIESFPPIFLCASSVIQAALENLPSPSFIWTVCAPSHVVYRRITIFLSTCSLSINHLLKCLYKGFWFVHYYSIKKFTNRNYLKIWDN